MKFIDEILELEGRAQRYKQDRMNALTIETATSPTAHRLLTKAALRDLKGPQQQEHKLG